MMPASVSGNPSGIPEMTQVSGSTLSPAGRATPPPAVQLMIAAPFAIKVVGEINIGLPKKPSVPVEFS